MTDLDVRCLAFELFKVHIKLHLPVLQDVIWLLLHPGHKQLEPIMECVDTLDVGLSQRGVSGGHFQQLSNLVQPVWVWSQSSTTIHKVRVINSMQAVTMEISHESAFCMADTCTIYNTLVVTHDCYS